MLYSNETFAKNQTKDKEKPLKLMCKLEENKSYEEAAAQRHYIDLNTLVEPISNLSIFILDKSYRYLMANERHRAFMKKLLGIDVQEGMNILNIFNKFYNNKSKDRIIKNIKDSISIVLKGDKINKTGEMLIKNDDIEYLNVEAVPVKNDEGEIIGSAVYSLNVTENINMHKFFLKMKMDINSKNKDKLDYLRNIKEEIEKPINDIRKSVDVLSKVQLNEKQIQYVDTMSNSVNYLIESIDNILDISRMKSEKFSSNLNINPTGEDKSEVISKKECSLLEDKTEKVNFEDDEINIENTSYNSQRDIKILVVEDNLVNQMVIGELIRMNGWNKKIVSNGKEAIETLKKEKYDLILMDISMPVMNGIEATKLIKSKKDWRDIPIVAMTGYALVEDKFNKLGMDDYLLKPVDADKLESIVLKHLKVPYQFLKKKDNYVDTKEYDEGFTRLEGMLDGNSDLVVKLGEKIINMLSHKELSKIIYLAEQENTLELRNEIHKLKGAVSNFKLTKVQKILNEIKENAMCGEIKDIYELIDEIEKNMEAFEERLTIYKYKCI